MIIMTGSWPTYYLSAYELKADRTWTKSSGASTGPIAYSEKFKAMAPPGSPESADDVHHQFCALIPNEPKPNELNVLLVSSYRDKKGINVINFRTYLKDGNPAPAQQPLPTQQPNPAATVSTPLRQGEKYITTEWRGRTVTKVPSCFFTPVDKVTERANLSVVEDSILKPGTVIICPPRTTYTWRFGQSPCKTTLTTHGGSGKAHAKQHSRANSSLPTKCPNSRAQTR